MGLDDYMQTEVGVAAAVTAFVLSPRVRHTVRRGAVLGLAGGIKAVDAVTATVRHAGDADGAETPAKTPPAAAKQG